MCVFTGCLSRKLNYALTTKRYFPAVLNACPLSGTGDGEPPGGVTVITASEYVPIIKAPAVESRVE